MQRSISKVYPTIFRLFFFQTGSRGSKKNNIGSADLTNVQLSTNKEGKGTHFEKASISISDVNSTIFSFSGEYDGRDFSVSLDNVMTSSIFNCKARNSCLGAQFSLTNVERVHLRAKGENSFSFVPIYLFFAPFSRS